MDDLDLNDDTDGNDGSDSSGIKSLRAQLRKLEADSRVKDAELAKFRSQTRTSTIADVLREAKAPAKLAKFVERDIEGDVTPDAVKSWLTDNGDIFGWSPDESSTVDEDTRTAASRISQATANAPESQAGALTVSALKTASNEQLKAWGIVTDLR